jgi:hypothetical protein
MAKGDILTFLSLALIIGAGSGCARGVCVVDWGPSSVASDASAAPTVNAGNTAGSENSSGGGSFAGAASAGSAAGSGGPLNATGPMPASGSASGSPSGGGATAQRAIVEADIVQLGAKYLYAMSKSGTVAIVDVSVPGKLALLGSVALPGTPFEMYEQGQVLVAMCNGAKGPAVAKDGRLLVEGSADAGIASPAIADGSTDATDSMETGPTSDASVDGAGIAQATEAGTNPSVATARALSEAAFTDPNSAVVLALDAHDPSKVTTLATFDVPGKIADSRMIGTVLYLTTYQNGSCFGCTGNASTVVTSFDVSDPTKMLLIDQARFSSSAPAAYNFAWGMAWQRSIVATTQRLYLGGQANVDPNNPSGTSEGIIDVVDVSDPKGHLGPGAHLTIPGPVLSRWQMDESQGVFRVVSEPGAAFTGNGTAMPEVTTFSVQSTTSFTPLGRMTLKLPMQEGLRTVQFDSSRAYAITFNQTDPLIAIDLSNAASPVQRGNLKMPGWMFYLQPMGAQVIGLGIDRTDPNGNLNVSLFDVSNLDSPMLLSRVAFGSLSATEDFQILDYELPEDQDNIQKAFRAFSDGLVAIPFSTVGTDGSSTCAHDAASGVQLMQLKGNQLVKHAVLPIPGNPKRALELGGELLAVSDSDVRAFSLANPDTTQQTADVSIGMCVQATMPAQVGPFGAGNPGGNFGGGGIDNVGNHGGGNQSAPPTSAPAQQASSLSWWRSCP